MVRYSGGVTAQHLSPPISMTTKRNYVIMSAAQKIPLLVFEGGVDK